MSHQFNDTTNHTGLVQIYELEIGHDPGFVSDNDERLKQFAAATRAAWDTYLHLAFKSSGSHQFDDSNHQDGSGNYTFPIIKTNIVQGRRDYIIGPDEQNNLVLDVHKAMILPSATATEYIEIYPIDQQTRDKGQSITSESTTQGVPGFYDKTAGTLIFDVPPSYAATNGLKMLINREPSYFTYQDTTKMPGCPGIHHRYFAIRPALEYCRQHDLVRYQKLLEEVVSYEGDEERGIIGKIERHFARRSKDERNKITNRQTPYI